MSTGVGLFEVDARHVGRGMSALPSDAIQLLGTSPPTTAEELSSLSSLYAGDLLASLDEPTTDLGQWVGNRRDALQQRFVGLAIEGAERVGGVAAETMLRHLSSEFPYNEEIERALLRFLARERPAAVAQAYDAFARRLRLDLGSEPEVETKVAAAEFVPALVAAMPRADDKRRPEIVAPQASRPSVPRLLVLPPSRERGVARSQELLGASLLDDVIYALCERRSFAVFAAHTARQLVRGSPYAGALPYAADYVVSTRLIPMGGHVRLGVSLAKTSSQEVLFAETLSFSEEDLPARRTDLIRMLVTRVASEVERSELSEMRRTGNASAYVHFLLGSEQIRILELANIRRARRYFRRAIDLSPNFTSALSMVARSLCLEWVLLDRPDTELLKSAQDLAAEAVAIDPFDPNGHRELGNAKLYLEALDESVEHLGHAAERAPHHADILVNQADALLHNTQSLPRARELVRTALELNPLAPDEYNWIGATIDFFLSDGAAAMTKLMRLHNKDAAARLIAAVAASNGDAGTAEAYRRIFMARHPDFRLANWYMPLRGTHERQRYLDALRRAGFS